MTKHLAVLAFIGVIAAGTSARAETPDPVCQRLTERLRGRDFVIEANRRGIALALYSSFPGGGPPLDADLPSALFSALDAGCSSARPAPALTLLTRVLLAAGDLDAALEAAERRLAMAEPTDGDHARSTLAQVRLARGDEAGAVALLRETRKAESRSDAELLAHAYRTSRTFLSDPGRRVAVLEAAVRHGRTWASEQTGVDAEADEDLADTLMQLGGDRSNLGRHAEAAAAYSEAVRLLAAKAQRLRAERPQRTGRLALVESSQAIAATYLALSLAAAGDRAGVVAAVREGARVLNSQIGSARAEDGTDLGSWRFASQLGRMGDALMTVGETDLAIELYVMNADAVEAGVDEDPVALMELASGLTRLAAARRTAGQLAGALVVAERSLEATAAAEATDLRSPLVFGGARLEYARILEARGDRAGACTQAVAAGETFGVRDEGPGSVGHEAERLRERTCGA